MRHLLNEIVSSENYQSLTKDYFKRILNEYISMNFPTLNLSLCTWMKKLFVFAWTMISPLSRCWIASIDQRKHFSNILFAYRRLESIFKMGSGKNVRSKRNKMNVYSFAKTNLPRWNRVGCNTVPIKWVCGRSYLGCLRSS